MNIIYNHMLLKLSAVVVLVLERLLGYVLVPLSDYVLEPAG